MANLYEAAIQDYNGEIFNARLRCATDVHAKEVSNAIALKSSGKWTDLFKISKIDLPIEVGEVDITPNFAQEAGEDSDVQLKGRLSYTTATAGNYIAVEIPSVKPAYLSTGARTTSTDPLTDLQRALLLSEDDDQAVSLHSAKYHKRDRKN